MCIRDRFLTCIREPDGGQCQAGSLTGAVASERVSEALKGDVYKRQVQYAPLTDYQMDLVENKDKYEARLKACLLYTSWIELTA